MVHPKYSAVQNGDFLLRGQSAITVFYRSGMKMISVAIFTQRLKPRELELEIATLLITKTVSNK